MKPLRLTAMYKSIYLFACACVVANVVVEAGESSLEAQVAELKEANAKLAKQLAESSGKSELTDLNSLEITVSDSSGFNKRAKAEALDIAREALRQSDKIAEVPLYIRDRFDEWRMDGEHWITVGGIKFIWDVYMTEYIVFKVGEFRIVVLRSVNRVDYGKKYELKMGGIKDGWGSANRMPSEQSVSVFQSLGFTEAEQEKALAIAQEALKKSDKIADISFYIRDKLEFLKLDGDHWQTVIGTRFIWEAYMTDYIVFQMGEFRIAALHSHAYHGKKYKFQMGNTNEWNFLT